jgi:hypothetical protein
MKREYFSHASKDNSRQNRPPSFDRCIALVDERYLIWLAQHAHANSQAEQVNRQALSELLAEAMAAAGVDVNIQRIYWYTEEIVPLDVDEQIVRKVFSHDLDGGISLLQIMGQDLSRLALNKACDHILLATDDERLLTVIDGAQLAGMSVHILADESARSMQKLHKTDPGWGRLLSQADRRVVASPKLLAELLKGGGKEVQSPAEDPQFIRDSMTEVIVSWWDDEPEDKREELRDELHINRGIPQEVDRQLLLRMRHRLTRALTLQEKKMLREIFRAVAFGNLSPESSQSADAASATPAIEEPI